MAAATTPGDETFDWEELLLNVEDRKVIPIVGKELLVLPMDGQLPLEQYLARQVAEASEIPAQELSENFDLSEVALRIDAGPARRKLYSKVRAVMKELTHRDPLPIPEPLKQLASITDFSLFVSTTFDPFLGAALDAVRFGGEAVTTRRAYSLHNEVTDLDGGMDQLEEPLVYQILGELSSVAGDYALTNEEILEFLLQLQSDRRPATLFDELKEHHLLFIGCGFPKWLALSFIRTLSNHPLREVGTTAEVIADRANSGNEQFNAYMRECQAYIFPSGDPLEFTRILAERWKERNPAAESGAKPKLEEPSSSRDAAKMESGAIFVSYASEDREAAQNLRAALEGGGLQVWFDKKDLKGGDDWKRALRKNIERCSLFMPLLSRRAEQRVEGVFREEWLWAIERSRGIAEGVPFIQPIVVDDLPHRSDRIPDEFWKAHVESFEKAQPSDNFVTDAKKAVREFRLGSR